MFQPEQLKPSSSYKSVKVHTLQKQHIVQSNISFGLSLKVTLKFPFYSLKIYRKQELYCKFFSPVTVSPTVCSSAFWNSEICHTDILWTSNIEVGTETKKKKKKRVLLLHVTFCFPIDPEITQYIYFIYIKLKNH